MKKCAGNVLIIISSQFGNGMEEIGVGEMIAKGGNVGWCGVGFNG